MPFATFTITTFKSGSDTFLKITPGVPVTIQILDETSTVIDKHWMTDAAGRRVGIVCPGKDVCPICQRNAEINYNREHPDYIPLQHRHRVNVLDLTPVKRCPKCGATYPETASPTVCSVDGCGASLDGVQSEPLAEVKILERGRRLMEQFNNFQNTPHVSTGKVEPLQSYPFMLIASGSGTQMVVTAIPQEPRGIDPNQYEKLDLNQGLKLDADEIRYLLSGGALKDIFAARKAEVATTGEVTAPQTTKEIPF